MEHHTTMRSRRTAAEEPGLYGIVSAADSTQRKLPKKGEGEGEEPEASGSQKLAKRGKELKEEMDALVDEIDEVLEENAEEFVKNYVQRGGE